MYPLYLGYRYARSRIPNYVAVAAIALAVTVQIVVMSILDGVVVDIQKRIQGLGEHITVTFPEPGVGDDVYAAAAAAIAEIPGVRGVTPALQLYGVVSCEGRPQPVMIRGIDLPAEMRHGELAAMLLDTAEAAWSDSGEGILMGATLASGVGADAPGATVRLEYANTDSDRMLRRTLPLTSRFRSGISYFDRHIVYIPLAMAQDMLAAPAQPVAIAAVWLDDPTAAPKLRDAVIAAVRPILQEREVPHFSVITWLDSFGGWFEAIAHEAMLQQVVMAFISLSGAFCIFAIMYMLVSGRVRDIGILRSIGSSRMEVASIFLLSGFLMGLAGALLGAAGGVALSPHVNDLWMAVTGEALYPPYLFGVTELPVHTDPWKTTLYALSAVAVSTLASLPAALYAGWRPPLEALRHE